MSKENIANLALWAVNNLSQSYYYEWDDKFSREENKRIYDKFYSELINEIDWENLTDEDCDFLRFGRWSKDSSLRLIPLYLCKIIPGSMKVTCIDGKEYPALKAIKDNDIRFGCLAYGIIPKNKR